MRLVRLFTTSLFAALLGLQSSLPGAGVPMASAAESNSLALCGAEAKACIDYGADVFQQRCALCHGYDGLGEGLLPISLPGYPGTNLTEQRLTDTDKDAIERVVRYGGGLPEVSTEMPPWGDELTATQLDSVVMFVSYLRESTSDAMQVLKDSKFNLEPSARIGRSLYRGRCSLCHGTDGLGDGKMARIIKDPPPYNLTESVMPETYLRDIILEGGERMGRSERMPPFGGDLIETEIASLIIHLMELRR